MFERSKICHSCAECNMKSELFSILNEEQTEILNDERYEVHFLAGENIVKQGTILTHITNLVKGTAKVYIEGFDKRNLILNIAGPQTILGGPGLFTDNRNHYTVTALEDSIVCFIHTDNFKKVLGMNKEFNEQFIRHLNLKTVRTFDKMISLTQKQMHGRLADSLIYLSETLFQSGEFELKLSRQDLADMSAMSKDSAIRVLKEFERDGIAVVNGKRVKILNPEALKELSFKG